MRTLTAISSAAGSRPITCRRLTPRIYRWVRIRLSRRRLTACTWVDPADVVLTRSRFVGTQHKVAAAVQVLRCVLFDARDNRGIGGRFGCTGRGRRWSRSNLIGTKRARLQGFDPRWGAYLAIWIGVDITSG
jgi:hypothetical protein